MAWKLTDQQKIDIINKYQTGNYTCVRLDKEYNVYRGTVYGILKRRKIKINGNQSELQRKYTLNENFFDVIDTEEKAYILGFLYADGYNNEKNNLIQIILQEDDLEILQKIKLLLNSNRPIAYNNIKKFRKNCKNQYRFTINSKHMSNKLKELGCMQKKSLILKFPTKNQVSSCLIRHFIRGYFDGDGYLGRNLNKKTNCYKMYCNIVSTLEFCESITILVKEILNINTYICKRHKNKNTSTRMLFISGTRQSYKFLKWIYKDSNISLNRKLNKFLYIENQLKIENKI